ncbi:MAG: response regulator transcription factor [Bdellovibrionales bacterium]|nr:response regulator transcription factor [Bdellovibrionales bacterium]
MRQILLIEDTLEVYQLVLKALGSSYHLDWAKTLEEGSRHIAAHKPDLILLDVELPDGNGFEYCQSLQSSKGFNTPIIILTAKSEVEDKVVGFTVGADDYIVKPFHFMELKARVDAKINKLENLKGSLEVLAYPKLELNKNNQRVRIEVEAGDWEDVDLTTTEFKLLLLLLEKNSEVLSRDEILDTVWGGSVNVFPRTIDTHISKLRKKIPSIEIRSAHGKGYSLVHKTN